MFCCSSQDAANQIAAKLTAPRDPGDGAWRINGSFNRVDFNAVAAMLTALGVARPVVIDAVTFRDCAAVIGGESLLISDGSSNVDVVGGDVQFLNHAEFESVHLERCAAHFGFGVSVGHLNGLRASIGAISRSQGKIDAEVLTLEESRACSVSVNAVHTFQARGCELESVRVEGGNITIRDCEATDGSFVAGEDATLCLFESKFRWPVFGTINHTYRCDFSSCSPMDERQFAKAIGEDIRARTGGIVYKQAVHVMSESKVGRCIVRLLIPNGAPVVQTETARGKMRAAEAVVLGFEHCDGRTLTLEEGERIVSRHDEVFQYVVGQVVRPDEAFNFDSRSACESGIHFFLNRADAVNY